MKVTNKTEVPIYIRGISIVPGESGIVRVDNFSTIHVHSEIGSCEIMCTFCERRFRNYGNVVAVEAGTQEQRCSFNDEIVIKTAK